MALKLPELEPRQYTYVGFACAFLGALLLLCGMLAILRVIFADIPLLWVFFSAGGILLQLVATMAFHKIGNKQIPL